MSRQLLCAKCSARKREGTRMVLARSAYGEPAEYERVLFGVAIEPLPRNRVVRINGQPIPMTPHQYDCDHCSAVIRPGDLACAWSIWTEDMEPTAAWEHEYLEMKEAHGNSA